jgi:hypothetical protein
MRRITRGTPGLWFSLICVSGWLCVSGCAALAKGKPLSWKSIDEALLRVNDAPPKEWEVYRAGKKNDPLIVQLGNRFLLVESHDHRIFELDPTKVERKKDEVLWSLSDRPAEALATSDWVVDDIGAAFAIQVKLEKDNASFDLQLPHPPDVGDLPAHPPATQQNRRRY